MVAAAAAVLDQEVAAGAGVVAGAAGASLLVGAAVGVAVEPEPCIHPPQDQPEEPLVTVAVTTSISVV